MLSILSFATLFAVVFADPTKTIVENAVATPSLSTLVSVLTMPDYKPVLDALSGPGPFTVFAPNNEAFKAAGVDPSQVETVTQVLMYHVLGAAVPSKDLNEINIVETLMSDPKFVTRPNNTAQVVDVIKTHEGVFINFGVPGNPKQTAKVVVADVICSNGVVHVIDTVLMFPELTSKTAAGAGLKTLVDAVVAADLVSAVDTTPGITILAPTDQAFAAIGGISKLTKEQLATVLTYHVIPAEAFSTDLKDKMKLPTLQGESIEVVFDGPRVVFKGSKSSAGLALPNVITQNAAVHVIDRVLIPSALVHLFP